MSGRADVRYVSEVGFENTLEVRGYPRLRVETRELRRFLFVAIYDDGNRAAGPMHGVRMPLAHQPGANDGHARRAMQFAGLPLHRLESLNPGGSPGSAFCLLR
jgi:hypothetical protein